MQIGQDLGHKVRIFFHDYSDGEMGYVVMYGIPACPDLFYAMHRSNTPPINNYPAVKMLTNINCSPLYIIPS
jgi:hypothetical protein